MDDAASLERTIERYNDAWNAHDVEAIVALHAPGMVFENHTAGERIEGADVGPHIARIFANWPDLSSAGAGSTRATGSSSASGRRPPPTRRGAPARVGRRRRLPVPRRADRAQGRLLGVPPAPRAPVRLTRHVAATRVPDVHRPDPRAAEVEEELHHATSSSSRSPAPEGANWVVAAQSPRPERRLRPSRRRGPAASHSLRTYAVGVDNVDLEAARASRHRRHEHARRAHARDRRAGDRPLLLALLRRVAEGDRFVRSTRAVGVHARVHARTGPRRQAAARRRTRAGSAGEMGRLAEAFGARVPHRTQKQTTTSTPLLRGADVVSRSDCPSTPRRRDTCSTPSALRDA